MCEARPARRSSIPASCSQVAPPSSRVTATTPAWSRRCASAVCTPAGCPGTTRRRCDADLVILRATWDYIERLDEFLAWTQPRAQPAQRARRGGVEHRQALPGRPRRGRRADGAEPILRAAASGCGCPRARWWSNPPSARDRLAHNGSPTLDAALRARGGAAGRRAAPCWCSPTTRGSPTARRRWCSSPAGSRTRSPRVRSCRRRAAAGVRRVRHVRRGVAAPRRARLRAVGRRACRAGRRGRPPGHRRRPSSSTPASTSSAARTTRGCWSWNWSSRRWAGASSMRPTRGPPAARVRARRGVSPRPARARPALASTPIAPRWPRCMRPRRRRGRRPAPRAHR